MFSSANFYNHIINWSSEFTALTNALFDICALFANMNVILCV